MADALNQILGYIKYIFEFLISAVEAMFQAVVIMNTSLSFITTISGMMPTIIGTAVMTFLAIYVIRFLCLK